MQKAVFFLFILFLTLIKSASSQQLNVDSLLIELNKSAEDTNKVNQYRMLTGLIRNTDPLKAITYGKAGVALGKKLGFDKGVAGCLLNISVCYSSASLPDSAMAYIDTAIIYSLKVGEPNRLALAYLNRADQYRQLNNFSQSLKDCDTSLKYADIADNDDRRARVLQTIGSVYYQQQSYEQSAEYYEKAFQLYQKIGNQQMSAIVLNNQGNTFKHLGYYDKSIASFTKAIAIGNSLNDLNNLSMYHENLSDAYLASGNISEAEKQGVTALKYAVQQANSLQLANAYECLGSVYLKQQKFAAAIESGLKAYDFAKEAKDVSIQYEITDLLAEAYSKSGNHAKAFEFLTISKNINDSLTRQQFDEDVSALQTKFKVDEKDKEIQLLNKDKELQSQKLTQQRILLIASIMLAFLAIGSIFLLINRSRLRQQMKELELRNQIAADLHDEVGSSLSSIHMLSQIANKKQSEDASQKEILDRMSVNVKETMDKMGDIVWMIKPGEGEGISLKNRMERFAQEVCSSKNIDLNMELGKLETMKLSMPQRKNLYLIFKEALNNAAKYSGTEKIDISIKEENKRLSFMLKDHGKGFDASRIAKGNGLDNMQNRARELNGELKINSAMDEGTIIQLDMPV